MRFVGVINPDPDDWREWERRRLFDEEVAREIEGERRRFAWALCRFFADLFALHASRWNLRHEV